LEAQLEEIKILMRAFARTVDRLNDILDEIDESVSYNPPSYGSYSDNSCKPEDDVGILILQSDTGIDPNPDSTVSEIRQIENVAFADDDPEPVAIVEHDLSYKKVDSSIGVPLGSFPTRPVKIWSKTWTEGTSLVGTVDFFNPWQAYFNHTSIKKKIDNYFMARCIRLNL
jgi:hypothetical protein